MAFEMDWSHSFCLACDRQTEGSVYCSEACRLADYEDASSSSSLNSSPITQPSFSWPEKSHTGSTTSMKLDDKLVETHPDHPSLSSKTSYTSHSLKSSPSATSKVTKSSANSPSSCSSRCSMRENRTYPNSEAAQISQDSERALRVYANAFDRTRYCRRLSGY
ncbi:hypothetical protein HI914_01307 [Erysiphe necator]|nr:hypothetical protein HI914_01307 [Erysiphe necator]